MWPFLDCLKWWIPKKSPSPNHMLCTFRKTSFVTWKGLVTLASTIHKWPRKTLELVTIKNEILKVPNPLLALLTFERSEIWQMLKIKKKRTYFLLFRDSNPGCLIQRQLCLPLYHNHLLVRFGEKYNQIVISVKFHSFQKLGEQAGD